MMLNDLINADYKQVLFLYISIVTDIQYIDISMQTPQIYSCS